MINLAVIEMKYIIKYLVRITIIVFVAIFLTRYFFIFRTKIENQTIQVKDKSFLSCLDEVIPGIEEINKKEQKENSNKEYDISKRFISIEIGMINSVQEKENVNNKNEADTEKIVEELQDAKTNLKTVVNESGVSQKFTMTYRGVKIKNETKIKLTNEMLNPDVKINKKNILIYHTHSCESYTQSKKYEYTKSGNFRTTNKERSVIRVGTELTNYMKKYGYNVIHDTSLYDYPSYNGSYGRSYANVSKLLDKNKNTEVLFDIHRDAIGDSSYAPRVKIGDEEAAQLMFVIGSNGSGAKHDNWVKNLKFAIKIQEKANELYPGLFKPMIIRNSRYNQHLANGASIIEVGATGNTLDQCLISMKYLAKVLTQI